MIKSFANKRFGQLFVWTFCQILCFFWANIFGVAQSITSQSPLTLHWKNGDVLSGDLLHSDGPWISWDSPVFLDPLRVNIRSLHSLRFPVNPSRNRHSFRFTTVSGDVFDADLIGSDDDLFSLKSLRYGDIQLKRAAVYAVHRKDHPDLLFNGSMFDDWSVALGGPILDLKYQVYPIDEEALIGVFPDFDKLMVVQEGHLASSYFDLGIADLKQHFGLQFEGRLEIKETDNYQFHLSANSKMRFWIDGELLVKTEFGNLSAVSKRLNAGMHTLKVEYLNGEGLRDLRIWWSGPGFKNRSLVGTNRQMGWHQDIGGQAITSFKRSGLFKAVDIPQSFVLELELESSGQPQFVLGFGESEFEAESKSAFKIETWGNEIVFAQGNKTESIYTLEEGQYTVSIRLIHDTLSKATQVFEANGRHLKHVQGMQIQGDRSGLFIRNRGEDLIVNRVSLYHYKNLPLSIFNDFGHLNGIELLDGTFHDGELQLSQDSAVVVSPGGNLESVDESLIGHVFSLNKRSQDIPGDVALIYQNGERISGYLESFTPESIHLKTTFSTGEVNCQLRGAARIEFKGSPSMSDPLIKFQDQLNTSVGEFRGQLVFGINGAAFGWKPDGAEKPLRVNVSESLKIERKLTASENSIVNQSDRFPSKLFLQTGEAFPCEITAYSIDQIGLKSPYLKGQSIDSKLLKAIEFFANSPNQASGSMEEESIGLLGKVFQSVSSQVQLSREEKLLQILNNSNIQNPTPTHLLVTLNGDLMRGTLTRILETKTLFESKSRSIQIPNDRLYGVVDIQPNPPDGEFPFGKEKISEGVGICLKLVDGAVIIIHNAQSTEETIVGQSRLYGGVHVPVENIQYLSAGVTESEFMDHKYQAWTVPSAK